MVQSHRRCAGEGERDGSLGPALHRLPGKGRLRAVAAVGQGCGEQMSWSTPFPEGGRAGVDPKLLTQNVRMQACLRDTLPACPGHSLLLVFTVKNLTAYDIICLFYT